MVRFAATVVMAVIVVAAIVMMTIPAATVVPAMTAFASIGHSRKPLQHLRPAREGGRCKSDPHLQHFSQAFEKWAAAGKRRRSVLKKRRAGL